LAEKAGDRAEMAVVDTNLGSLYMELGDIDAAAQLSERGLKGLTGPDHTKQIPDAQIVLATLRARQNRAAEALELFRQGIQGADRMGNIALYTNAWTRLGEEFLKRGRLAEADSALLEAYRVRKLHHLPLDATYRSLGRLRLEQGDLASAAEFLDRAVEASQRPGGPIPAWDAYHYRGRARMQQGRLPEAVEDLRTAVRLARAWRWTTPTGDTSRIGAETWLSAVHGAFVEAANRLYLQTGDAALARESFEIAEENRAASLRDLWRERQEQLTALPSDYWNVLSRLQKAEIAALRDDRQEAKDAVRCARADLARIESGSTTQPHSTSEPMLPRLARSLDPGTTLFSFQLGDTASWLWAIDHQGLQLYRLPSRDQIAAQADAAVNAIRDDSVAEQAASARLYQTLFGAVSAHFEGRPHWLLSVDSELFAVPFAALIDGSGYLAERHTTEIITGAANWLETRDQPPVQPSSLFVGVADPIYNDADPRRTRKSAHTGFALPRLVGSRAELETAAGSWNGSSILLQGSDASRDRLTEALRRNPAVVHIAAHVLRAPAYGLIALSLNDRHQPELLHPAEIAHWRTQADVVVLSGCASAAGVVLQGTGLMGLTRAWLAAGSRSVVGTLWVTPDEPGSIFRSFYLNLHLNGRRQSAHALQTAQREMIHSADWRSRPRYWGAYFTIGNQ